MEITVLVLKFYVSSLGTDSSKLWVMQRSEVNEPFQLICEERGVAELSGAKLTLAAQMLASCQIYHVAVFRYQTKECEARELLFFFPPAGNKSLFASFENLLLTLAAAQECVDVSPHGGRLAPGSVIRTSESAAFLPGLVSIPVHQRLICMRKMRKMRLQ